MRQEDQVANNEVVRIQKKEIRDEFLNNFYIPRRMEYEEQIDKYAQLWPIKDADMAEESQDISFIFQYGEIKDQKRYPASGKQE